MSPLAESTCKLRPFFGGIPPYVSFAFADFNPYLFTVMNHKHEYNSFPEFCDPFYGFIELEDGLGESQ